jgi:molecular chaperone DnaK
MAEERRSSHRIRISGVRVTYESATGESVETDALDLGGGGVFVRTAMPLPVGKRIALEIQVIGETGPWSAIGRVIWTREKGGGDKAPPGMGVKLIDADDAVMAAIERLVETREHTEPGVGKGSNPPPAVAPVIAIAPERERTLMGVGSAPEESPPAPPPPREASIAIDLVSRGPAPVSAPIPPAVRPPIAKPPLAAADKGGGSGRLVVILLLLVVAGVAAYVLLDGFLRPPSMR